MSDIWDTIPKPKTEVVLLSTEPSEKSQLFELYQESLRAGGEMSDTEENSKFDNVIAAVIKDSSLYKFQVTFYPGNGDDSFDWAFRELGVAMNELDQIGLSLVSVIWAGASREWWFA